VDFDVDSFLESRARFGMRFGLERIERLLDSLGRPDAELPAMHVVGTNGKSSTTRFAAAALGAQGLTVGSFTSPQLRGLREGIEVAGAPVALALLSAAGQRVAEAVARLDDGAADDDRVTQYEAACAIALCAMRAAGCEVAVVEAGLGGRLDATNAIADSRVQVLTNVALDHTDLLGDTTEQIAAEKLAVVRAGAVLVHGALDPPVRTLAARTALERGARLLVADEVDPVFGEDGEAAISGRFLQANATLALVAAEAMYEARGVEGRFDPAAAAAAIATARDEGLLEGRLTLWEEDPPVVLDCAHNAAAAASLVAELPGIVGGRPVTLVVGVLADKRVDDLLRPLLAAARSVVCTKPGNERALAADALRERVRALAPALDAQVIGDPLAALVAARQVAGTGGAILVAGSNYLIADLVRGKSSSSPATF
jgi:dihydrofolate synthase/folylpolyglutamate synthase